VGPVAQSVYRLRYGLDGPGIESRLGGEIFRTCPDRPWGPPSLLYSGYGVPGVKSGWGVTLAPHPLLVPWSWKSRAIPLLPPWAVRPVQSVSACTRVTFTFTINFITQSVLYETTTYVVGPKILHYLVHVLQRNIQMNILRSYVHISVKWYLTLRWLMSYIYGAPILDVSRSHITTQHSR
jgi:hypothetical protein